jgi:hypothetical protein
MEAPMACRFGIGSHSSRSLVPFVVARRVAPVSLGLEWAEAEALSDALDASPTFCFGIIDLFDAMRSWCSFRSFLVYSLTRCCGVDVRAANSEDLGVVA